MYVCSSNYIITFLWASISEWDKIYTDNNNWATTLQEILSIRFLNTVYYYFYFFVPFYTAVISCFRFHEPRSTFKNILNYSNLNFSVMLVLHYYDVLLVSPPPPDIIHFFSESSGVVVFHRNTSIATFLKARLKKSYNAIVFLYYPKYYFLSFNLPFSSIFKGI